MGKKSDVMGRIGGTIGNTMLPVNDQLNIYGNKAG